MRRRSPQPDAAQSAAFTSGPPANRPARSAPRGSGRASRYDAAQTTDENKNHWAAADSLSPNAANSPHVRHRLRTRARYECENNGYAGGLVRGRAEATVGVCPRLQLTLPETYTANDADFQRTFDVRLEPDEARALARAVEDRWNEWADATSLADKLRLMDKSETREGEVFGVTFTNPRLDPAGVQLDLKPIEADQCATPDLDPTDRDAVDGIRFDRHGNPAEYHFLKRHPGDALSWTAHWEYDRYPAARVFHLFDPDRCGQARGVSALTPGLPLYAILRRYTLASLGAAELAAMIAGVIENPNAPIGDDDADAPEFEAMDAVPFARNALLNLAGGQTAKAFKSEQPSPSYREFKGEVLTEAGRGVGAARNTATGSSAEYNFSSGRLDKLPEQTGYRIRRDRWRRLLLDRLFRMWLAEAVLIPGYLPANLPAPAAFKWKWRWDGFGSIDPVKDATANEIKLRSGETTLEHVAGESGEDWEEVIEQQAREMRLRLKHGLPANPAQPTAAPAATKKPAPDAEPAEEGTARD
jgi:lambda family phage portal protein